MNPDKKKPPRPEINPESKIRFKNNEMSAEYLDFRSPKALEYAAKSIEYLFDKFPIK